MEYSKNNRQQTRYFLGFLMLVLCLLMWLGLEAYAARNKKAEITAYRYMINEMRLNAAAASGIMANIYAESNFDSDIWDRSGVSYGICQWLGSRKSSLYTFCTEHDLDKSSLIAQLKFMEYELENIYPTTYQKIRNVEVSEDGAYSAAYIFCYEFERPANKAYRSEQRGGYAKDIYWPEYGAVSASLSVEEESKGIKLTWESFASRAYLIYRASSADGTYQKIGETGEGVNGTYTDKSAKKGVPWYYQLRAKSAPKNQILWSNVASCTMAAKLDDPDCKITLSKTTFRYTGNPKTPKVTVTYGSTALVRGVDFTVTYSKNVNASKKGTVTVTGIGKYSGSQTIKIWIRKAPQKLSKDTLYVPYDKKAVKIDVGQEGELTMTSADKHIVSVHNQKLRGKKYGSTTVTIKAAGTKNYRSEKITVKVVVVPPAPKIKSVAAAGKSGELVNIRVKWKAKKKPEGFELQYGNGSAFPQGAEKIKIKKKSLRSYKIRELDDDCRWYFRIRSYRTVNGKKCYSPWSETVTFGSDAE